MKLGKFQFDRPLALAPMEEITDTPFRLICKRLGADLLYTEFTSAEALIRDARKALDKIQVTDPERPIGIQIFGSRETSMREAARIAESAHPDFIDINCGCWVRNHAARGEGAGLLKDLKQLERVIRVTVKGTSLPVTLKTRLGWDADHIVIRDVAKIAENAGVQAITIHCRTRSQAHKGSADWTWLSKIKKEVSIAVIGNGDIKTPQDAKDMLETGCDGIMIGRAAVTNPWIFKQTKAFLNNGVLAPTPSLKEQFDMCADHLKLCVQYHGQWRGIVDFRKHYSGYLRGLPHIARLRAELAGLSDEHAIIERLYGFLDQYSMGDASLCKE